MTPDRLEHFRTLLTTRRQHLLAHNEAAREDTQPVALNQGAVGRLSRMDALQGQAMAVETQRRRDRELQRIEAALTRLDEGEYGLCLECEEEIPLRRLEVDPAALFCIGCATRRERR